MSLFKNAIDWIFGETNDQRIKRIRPLVEQINALEGEMQRCSEEQLRAKTAEFQDRLQKGETLDGLLPEAFAVVREMAQRKVGLPGL